MARLKILVICIVFALCVTPVFADDLSAGTGATTTPVPSPESSAEPVAQPEVDSLPEISPMPVSSTLPGKPESDESEQTGSALDVSVRIEQTRGRLPSPKLYFFAPGADISDISQIAVTVDAKPATLEDLKRFSNTDEGITYIVLVDQSDSIGNAEINVVRETLSDFVATFREKDRLVLLAFGEKTEVLLSGDESFDDRAAAIETLNNKQTKTKFNDAILKAVEIADVKEDGAPERTVLLVISDGEDYDATGASRTEVDAALKNGNLPLYAVAFDANWTPGSEVLKNFGELARESGGDIVAANRYSFGDSFDEMIEQIADPWVLSLSTESNVVSADAQTVSLSVTVGGKVFSAEKDIWFKESAPDIVPPEVVGITQVEGENAIRIEFSEAVLGADQADSYLITGAADISVATIKYEEQEGLFNATLYFGEEPYSGSYSVSFPGITDASMEKNTIGDSSEFEYDGRPIIQKYLHTVFVDYWWVVLIIIIAAIAVILYRFIHKRKGLVRVDGKITFGDAVEFKHHFETPETSRVSLIVTDMKGKANKVEVDVNKSLFVGRSDINNLSFDDIKMSRQHFVIEIEEDGFFVTDLMTTNGTFVNGIRLQGRRKLLDNDVITAGQEKFVFKGGAL